MELKARIYDKKRKQMLYSHKPEEQGKREYYPLVFSIGFSHWNESEFSEPMLSIGLSDKHGKEIYEGDILRGEKGDICVVEWEEAIDRDRFWATAYGFGIYFTESHADGELEIIGTIWEHPELLETQEEANEPR